MIRRNIQSTHGLNKHCNLRFCNSPERLSNSSVGCILHLSHSQQQPSHLWIQDSHPWQFFLNSVVFSLWSLSARSLSLLNRRTISAKKSLSSGLISASNCHSEHQDVLEDALVATTANADSDLSFVQP